MKWLSPWAWWWKVVAPLIVMNSIFLQASSTWRLGPSWLGSVTDVLFVVALAFGLIAGWPFLTDRDRRLAAEPATRTSILTVIAFFAVANIVVPTLIVVCDFAVGLNSQGRFVESVFYTLSVAMTGWFFLALRDELRRAV